MWRIYLLLKSLTSVYSSIPFIASTSYTSFLTVDPAEFDAFVNATYHTRPYLLTGWDSSPAQFCPVASKSVAFLDHSSIRWVNVNEENQPWGALLHSKPNVKSDPPSPIIEYRSQLEQHLQSNETKILHIWSTGKLEIDENQPNTEELQNLNQLIRSKVADYHDELKRSYYDFIQKITSLQDTPSVVVSCHFPHPNRILHFIAPKIPAIRQSPDIMLRIVAADNTDIHVAAYALLAIGTGLSLHETYYRHAKLYVNSTNISDPAQIHWDEGHKRSHHAVGQDILIDRRFEQVLECILCRFDKITIPDILQVLHALHALRFHKSTQALCDTDPRQLLDMLANRTHSILLDRVDTLIDRSQSNKARFFENVKSLSHQISSSIQGFMSPTLAGAQHLIIPTCVEILLRKIQDLWITHPKESSCSEMEEEIIDKLAISEEGEDTIKDHDPTVKDVQLECEWGEALVCDLLSCTEKQSILHSLDSLAKTCSQEDVIHTLMKHIDTPNS